MVLWRVWMLVLNKNKIPLLVLLLFVSLFLNSVASAQQKQTISFASMRMKDIDDKNLNFVMKYLVKELYDLGYSTFPRVAAKVQRKDIVASDLKHQYRNDYFALRPHSKNRDAINDFHNQLEADGETFVTGVATDEANRSLIIIFPLINEYHVNNFKEKKTAELYIAIKLFYLDSKSFSLEYLKINESMLLDPMLLKEHVSSVMNVAVEKAVSGASGGIGYGSSTGSNSSDSSAAPDTGAAAVMGGW